MSDIFNYAYGKKLKDDGISRASSWPFSDPTHIARNVAIMLAKKNGEVTADDVHHWMETAPNREVLGPALDSLQEKPAAWGSVFKTPMLKFSGRVKNSEKVSRHTGIQRIWEYNP